MAGDARIEGCSPSTLDAASAIGKDARHFSGQPIEQINGLDVVWVKTMSQDVARCRKR